MTGRDKIRLYLAPLEGITGHIYRNTLEKYFPGTDRYFTPFIAPDQKKILRTKERRDVLPEHNRTVELVPQILTNNAQHFLQTAEVLQEMGYGEVNLNLGCPSGTVASRKRGSGLLAYPDELDRLLDEIFSGTDMRISVKTRIGRDDAGEAFDLMEIYRKYPLSELIIHPRTQKDFYRGKADQELFGTLLGGFYQKETDALKDCARPESRFVYPICYNGDLLTVRDYCDFVQRYPQVDAVMLGRGVIANPGLIHQIRTGEPTDPEKLRAFGEEVLEGYREIFGEDRNALFRMKEIWMYQIHLFTNHEKYAKKIKKAQNLTEYRLAVDALFREQTLLPDGPEQWNLPKK